MRTFIYIDGFNLYYRMLEKRPQLKWVNPKALAEAALDPLTDIVKVRYYTARISGRTDPAAPARQQIYLNALGTVPEIEVHMGTFLSSTKFAGLVHPPEFRPVPAVQMDVPWPAVVKIHKTEEKGSDVNLASHLLLDAFEDAFDVAVVLSNDSDLVEPIRIATQVLGRQVGLLSPVNNPNPQLKSVACFVRHLNPGHLAKAQFADAIFLGDGRQIAKPITWA
jgi:uncharacterized LabA/DUF88 family protein